MTCLNALFAALKRPWRLAFPASDHKSRPTSGDGCHTAQTMRQMHWPDENALSTPYHRMQSPSVDLKPRAIVYHNRNAKGVAKYMRIHTILSKGR
jgi:hypothetical protein